MASILVPVLYVVVVFGGLFLFSHFYRKAKATKVFEPYFPSHPERDTYVTLLQRDPPCPDPILKAALVRRAMTDVMRVLRIREDKPALQNLLQKGSIGDDLWNSVLAAEKELEAEIMETVAEANSFVEGWGTIIFETASQMLANEKMRSQFEQTAAMRTEKEAIYGKSAKLAVKSLPAASAPAVDTTPAPIPTPVAVPAPAPATAAAPSTPAPAAPAPDTDPATPSTAKSTNGLTSPVTAPESVISDAETEKSSVSGTPSKSSKKKSKKRK